MSLRFFFFLFSCQIEPFIDSSRVVDGEFVSGKTCRQHRHLSIQCADHFRQKVRKRIGASGYHWEAIHAPKRFLKNISIWYFHSVLFFSLSWFQSRDLDPKCRKISWKKLGWKIKLNFWKMFIYVWQLHLNSFRQQHGKPIQTISWLLCACIYSISF